MDIKVILEIPVEVLRDNVLTFLTLNELALLDAATCNKALRSCLHERIKGVTFTGVLSRWKLKSGPKIMKWLCCRGISLENISLSTTTSDETYVIYGKAFARTKNCILGGQVGNSERVTPVITQFGFSSFVDNCPFLEYLHIAECQGLKSGISITYLASRCLKLHSLDLSVCKWVRDCDIEILSSCCPQLRLLRLCACLGISNSSLVSLSKHCAGLLSLNVQANRTTFTDVGIEALAQGCKSLKIVNIPSCSVTSKGVLLLASNCSSLHTLDLAFCDFVTESGFLQVIRHFKAIRSLSLSGNQFVTDAVIYALAAHCKQCRELEFSYCSKITDQSVLKLVEQCSSITKLCIDDCPLINAATEKRLAYLSYEDNEASCFLINKDINPRYLGPVLHKW
jgi:hypothetical protein